jgi:hypothetical protein
MLKLLLLPLLSARIEDGAGGRTKDVRDHIFFRESCPKHDMRRSGGNSPSCSLFVLVAD